MALTARRLLRDGLAMACDARLERLGGNAWTRETTLGALAAWDGIAPPPAPLAQREAVEHAATAARATFAEALRSLLANAVALALLRSDQAEALLLIADAAVDGMGPAGRETQLEDVRPARTGT